MISRGNSNRLVPNRGIWFLNQKPLTPSLQLAWTVSSIPCRPLNTHWRCSGGPCRLVLHAVASIGSPTGSPRSPPKRANSAHPENGQRLAGYVANHRKASDGTDGRLQTRSEQFGRDGAGSGLSTP